MILRKKIYCKSTKNERKGSHNEFAWLSFVLIALFLTTVEVGQYFMTKDTEEFSQFTESVACREYTLPRDEKSSDPKGWIRQNTKIGPVLEVTTSYLQGKYGVKIVFVCRFNSNSHSWVRISHGLNKLVTDLSNKEDDDNEQETSEMQFEDFALKTNVLAFASRSKAEAKPRRRTSACSSTRTVPTCERSWTDIEPENYSPIACPVSKQLSTLLRHGHLPREEDGAMELCRLKDFLRNEFWALSTLVWWNAEESNGKRRRQQEKISILYWFFRNRNSLSPSSSRSPRTQSHWSFITGQCINSEQFLRVLSSHRMCNQLTFHHKFRIDTGRTKFEQRKTDGILYVWDPVNKEHSDPNKFDLEAPRLAWYKQKKWKIHQDTVYWVDIKLAQQKGFKFYQTRSNAVILYDRLPAYCIPKAVMMGTGEIRHEKYMRHLLLRR